MKLKLPIWDGKTIISAGSRICASGLLNANMRTIRQAAAESSSRLTTPCSQGMVKFGISACTSTSPQRPEPTVSPLPKR